MIETFYEVMRRKGISRRSYLKYCSLTATSLGLAPSFVPQIAHVMKNKPRTPDRAVDQPRHRGTAERTSECPQRRAGSGVHDGIAIGRLRMTGHRAVVTATTHAHQATPSSAREAPNKAGDWADVITHTGMACK